MSRKKHLLPPLRCALAALLAAWIGAPALAQDGEGGEGQGGEEAAPAEDTESATDRWLAIVGGDVHTGTGAVLRGATLIARNGKIRAIGYDLYYPPAARVIEARGLRVYPGLVAISSQGLLGSSNADLKDTIDPFNYRMTLGLASGITTTGAGSAAAKLKRFSISDAVLNERVFANLTWSNSNPRQKEELVAKFRAAAEYLRKYRDWEERRKSEKELPEPPKRGVDNNVVAILRGEVKAKFNTNDAYDLLGIARLAQEYGFRPVIEGCLEGWTVADELGRAGAYVILTPRDRRPKDERQVAPGGASIENAALLHRAGVQVAVVPASEGVDLGGLVGRDIMHLPIEAGFAVRGGLSERAALESITTVPARILGVSHRVGTLEVGKDCDVIVTDGDVLHYKTFVQWAVVDGKVVYDKQKELFFSHIRPRAEEAPKLDAGETPPEAAPPAGEGEQPDEKPKPDDKPDEKPGEKPGGEGGGDAEPNRD
jgi:imidazolonepropionase-like amidohydrolase